MTGPLIDALHKRGYNADNLLAAPYDWRLPPSKLEERDHYFSGPLAAQCTHTREWVSRGAFTNGL